MRVTIYTNGQIMLPAKIRNKLDIKPGDSLAFFMNEDGRDKEIVMCKIESVQAMLEACSARERAKRASETAELEPVSKVLGK